MSKMSNQGYQQPGFVPASNYQPGAGQTTNTVIITSPARVTVGPDPTRLVCPSCHADVITDLKREANNCTHFWALGLCIFLAWPCVCLPYCCDSCQSAVHYCPNCHAYIGTYNN